MNRESIKKFLIVTCSIAFAFIFIFETILTRLGEVASYEVVLEQQQEKDVSYLPKFSNVAAKYKVLGIKKNSPQIIALGSSRIMPVHQGFFSDTRFYNAAVDASTGKGIKGMFEILKSLESHELPEAVIVEFDPWHLNSAYPGNVMSLKNLVMDNKTLVHAVNIYRGVKNRLRTYGMLIEEKSNWVEFLGDNDNEHIGLNAKLNESGYQKDGSFTYPQDYKSEETMSRAEWLKSLKGDRYRFAPGGTIDDRAKEQLIEFLEFCRRNNIEVVGLLLPFRNDFYDALIVSPGYAQYLHTFRTVIGGIVSRYGFICLDLTSPDTLRLKNHNFYDRFHMKEEVSWTVIEAVKRKMNTKLTRNP